MTGDAAVWNAWTTATAVSVAPASGARLVRVRLPSTIDPGPDGAYADLRVVDDRNAETPFAIDPQPQPEPARRVRLTDTGFVPHRYSQAVLDQGDGSHADTITIEVDVAKRPTYFERVTVEASDDRKTWRIVRAGAIVYRVADDRGRGNQRIAFPQTDTRWLRLRVDDPQEPFPIVAAYVADTHGAQPGPQPLAPVATGVPVPVDAAERRQLWTFDGGGVALRPSAVTFADRGSAYARHVVVESSDDGANWTPAGDATITRFAEGGTQTSFAFCELSARQWRVAVENGDDAPVPGLRPTLLARPHDVVFEAAPQRRYRLLSGNEAAAAPTYDLAARLAHSAWRAQPGSAVAARANATHIDDRTSAQRPPWLLTAALIAVAAGLAALAVATLRSTKGA